MQAQDLFQLCQFACSLSSPNDSQTENLVHYVEWKQLYSGQSVHIGLISFVPGDHRGRIYTEEKAKVVAAAWGTELLQFLAALAILHQDANYPVLQLVLANIFTNLNFKTPKK